MPNYRIVESPLWESYLALVNSPAPSCPPVNLRERSHNEIVAAAEYAVRIGMSAIDVATHNSIPLTGTIVEIGPGADFGASLLLGEKCEKLIVADRFLAPWRAGFHPKVYREMQRVLGRPARLLDEVVAKNSYEGLVQTLKEPASELTSIPNGTVDLVYSNAALEHVHPLDKAVREFYRITRLGGYGAHQIDFRYHQNFDLPLEHLLFTREEHAKVLEATHTEAGCQTRLKEAAEMFQAAGFVVARIDVNLTASETYMRGFLPRLRRSTVSSYKNWPANELDKLGARIFVRKPGERVSDGAT